MSKLLTSGTTNNIGLSHMKKIREETIDKWSELGFLKGVTGKPKKNIAKYLECDSIQFMNDYDQLGEWGVYILECFDYTLYTGATNDIVKRLKAHRSGKGAKYTRGRLPLTLEAFYIVGGKSEALKLEYKIKQMKKSDKIKYLRSLKEDK